MSCISLKRRGRLNLNKECPIQRSAVCMKQLCAWYLVKSKQCAIPLIATSTRELVSAARAQATAYTSAVLGRVK